MTHRHAWEPPEDLLGSQWADRYRRMHGPAALRPGMEWSTPLMPHTREPLDLLTHPDVRRMTLKWAAQCAKTEVLLNCVGCLLDQRPRPGLYVLDSEHNALRTYNNRILYLFRYTPRLARLMTGRKSDESGLKINLTDESAVLEIVWPTPGQLASWPKELVVIDEVNKVEQAPAAKEGNVVDLALVRMQNFEDTGLALLGCTPTDSDGRISVEFELSDQRTPRVPCMVCGCFYGPDRHHVKTPKGVDHNLVKKHNLARYACPHCHEHLTDKQRIKGLQFITWNPAAHEMANDQIDFDAVEEYANDIAGPDAPAGDRLRARHAYIDEHNRGEVEIPSSVGYQTGALISPLVSLGAFAAEDLKTKKHVASGQRRNFINSWCGDDWTDYVGDVLDVPRVRRLCEGQLPRGTAPADTQHIIDGLDVQADHFWRLKLAVGYEGRFAVIDANRAETWEELLAHTVHDTTYTDDGDALETSAVMIDSAHRPDEVLDYCREHLGTLIPVYGQKVEHGKPITTRGIDTTTEGKTDPSGLHKLYWGKQHFIGQALRIQGAGYKNASDTRLLRFFEGVPDYVLAQTISWALARKTSKVTKLTRDVYEPKKSNIPDHLLFCLAYCLVAIRFGEWDYLRPEEDPAAAEATAEAVEAGVHQGETGETESWGSAYETDDWGSRF